MTSILQHNCQNTGQVTEKTRGRGWVVFVSEYNMAEHSLVSRGRNKRTINKKHSKNVNNTTRGATSAIGRIFAELNNPFSPKLADK